MHLVKAREQRVIACEELNFVWDESEISKFITSWNDGDHIADIAKLFKRRVEEIVILILDLGLKKRIGRRPGGVYGNAEAGRKNLINLFTE